MIELGEGGGAFAGAGTWGGNNDERFGGFNVRVGAITFIRNDGVYVGRIALSEGVNIGGNIIIFKAFNEFFDFFLAVVKSNDDVIDSNITAAEELDKADNFGFVRDDAVGADFGFFDIAGVNTENNFHVFFEFLDEADFKVRFEAWQDASGVVIVDKFAAKFDIEFVEELDSFFYLGLL